MTTPTPGPAPARSFGRVTDDGTVFVRLPNGEEHRVGQYTAGTPDEALDFYARKFEDLSTEIDLTATRLADNKCTPREALVVANKARDNLGNPGFVGDVALLMAKIGQLEVLANIRSQLMEEERKQAQAEAAVAREAIVVEAEGLAESHDWRKTGDRFRELVDQWKALPKPTGEQRAATDALWERFRTARKVFDKARKTHREEQERKQTTAAAAKTELVAEAQKLSASTDWIATAGEYRTLMERWKKAGFAGKKHDEQLWTQFKAAQDEFFTARKTQLNARDAEQAENLKVKEALVVKAEALLPIKDAKSAKRAFRELQGEFLAAGHVPIKAKRRIDTRMKAVEDAIRDAEQAVWRRTNPEIRDRANGLVDNFRKSVAKLEEQLAKAQDAGADTGDLESSLAQQKLLLESAERSASSL